MDINTPEGINTDNEDKLFDLLSEKELEVMYWACQGYTVDKIADIRHVVPPTVKTQLGNVYKKLEFPKDLSDHEKRDYLISNYASVINKLFPDRKSLDSLHERKLKWEVRNLQKRREPKSDIDQKLNESKETQVITEPPPRVRLNQSFLWIGLGVLGFIVIAVILVLATGNNGQGEIIPTTVVALIQPTSTVQQIPLIEVSTSEPIATSTPSTVNDIAPLPTPTHTYTPLPTDTPLPTNTTAFTNTPANTSTPELINTPTEIPTLTPSVTPLPQQQILFSDNFDTDWSDEWNVFSGEPLISNRSLTTTDSVWMSVGDETWTNYEVELTVIKGRTIVSNMERLIDYVCVRFQDSRNMIAYRWANNQADWVIIEDGQTTVVTGSKYNPGNKTPFKIKLIVKDNTFEVVNGTSFSSTKFPTGGIAIRLFDPRTIDDLSVKEIP